MLSKRAERFMYNPEEVLKYSVWKALQDPYDPVKNPDGIVNMGTAVNGLMDDILLERFKENNNFYEASSLHFRYYQFWGSNEFLKKLAGFMTKIFGLTQPLSYENIFVLNGALLSLDMLVALIGDEEDVILLPAPSYNGYNHAGSERWNVKMCPIPLTHNEKTGEFFELTMSKIEKVFEEQIRQGKNVRAFLLNNPHNPLGKVYPKELVLEIMKFCQRNKLHLIADEIYCMSIFDKNAKFHSVLELKDDADNILDHDLIHVYWGFSKDLCLTSFRTGVIHTQNDKLKMALRQGSEFQAVPLPVLNILENYISDFSWFDNIFVPKNHERLRHSYKKSKEFFESLGITTTPTSAGFFFLVDFRPLLKPANPETVKALVEIFYSHKVYLTPSWDMKIPEPGWFRVVFTFSDQVLEEGFSRIRKALQELKGE